MGYPLLPPEKVPEDDLLVEAHLLEDVLELLLEDVLPEVVVVCHLVLYPVGGEAVKEEGVAVVQVAINLRVGGGGGENKVSVKLSAGHLGFSVQLQKVTFRPFSL